MAGIGQIAKAQPQGCLILVPTPAIPDRSTELGEPTGPWATALEGGVNPTSPFATADSLCFHLAQPTEFAAPDMGVRLFPGVDGGITVFRRDVGQDVGKRKIIATLNYWTILRHGPFGPDPEHINNSPLRAAVLMTESKHMTHLSRQIRAHNADDSVNPNYDHAVAPADRVCPSAIVSSVLILPLQHEAT